MKIAFIGDCKGRVHSNRCEAMSKNTDISFDFFTIKKKNLTKICKKYVSQYIKNGAYLGDALNDSLAIKHSFLGLCMQHGSHVCKTDSDIIIREPYDSGLFAIPTFSL